MHGKSSHSYNSIVMHFSFSREVHCFFVYLHLFGIFYHFSLFFACCFKNNVYICNIFVYKSECTRYEVRGSLFIYSQKNLNNMQK